MVECERLFGAARGREIQVLAEAVTGGPCPCAAGRPCPIMATDAASGSPPRLVLPRVADS